MSTQNHELPIVIPMTNYTKPMFEQTLRQLKRTTAAQTLNGSGTVDVDTNMITYLNSAGPDFVATLPNGIDVNQMKELYFIGSGGSFTVNGTFQNFTALVFDTGATGAQVVWVNNRWVMVAGNARLA